MGKLQEFPYTMMDILPLLGIQIPQNKEEFYIPCPNCDVGRGTGKHLNVVLQRSNGKDNVFRCPKCDLSGGVLDLYMAYNNIPSTQRSDAMRRIKEKIPYRDGFVRPVPPKTTITHVCADIKKRDATYRMLLGELILSKRHLEDLLNRGLTEDEIKAGGYRSTPTFGSESICRKLIDKGAYLRGVPGFYRNEKGNWDVVFSGKGLLIPVKDIDGMIQGLQLRLDKQDGVDIQRKYRWVSSSGKEEGTQSTVWCHFTGTIGPEIYLTEGPLKADIAALRLNKGFVAVPGVNSLSYLPDMLKDLSKRGVKKVYIAYDMDFIYNIHVQNGLSEIKEIIKKTGLVSEQIMWDPHYKGIDDYLTRKQ